MDGYELDDTIRIEPTHDFKVEDLFQDRFYANNDDFDEFLHPNPGSLETKPNKIADAYDATPKQIRDAIHEAKRDPTVRALAKSNNPDIGVDLETGEIYIQIGKKKFSGDSIGNIEDFIQ